MRKTGFLSFRQKICKSNSNQLKINCVTEFKTDDHAPESEAVPAPCTILKIHRGDLDYKGHARHAGKENPL